MTTLFLVIGAYGLLKILGAFDRNGLDSKPGLKDFRTAFKKPGKKSEFTILPDILEKEVEFYKNLKPEEKDQFIRDMTWFLEHIKITGIEIEVTDFDIHLVAASGIIPIFYFPEWNHYELDEILLYKDSIDIDFQTDTPDSNILGMVGTGLMERKMILSRKALHDGFQNKTDKHNTAIHEFIHLVDKADGRIDGLPKILMDKQYALPWLQMIREKIKHIHHGQSDIDPYGATNLSEFLAVSSEYFFERPDLLKIKHPELYKYLDQMFKGKITT